MTQYVVQRARWKEAETALKQVRFEVFIEEQNVPQDMEIDAHDPLAIHALVSDESNTPIATGRLLESGKIGRMAVRKPWRGQGIGASILRELMQISIDELGEIPYLEAQITAIPFYEKYGFRTEGDEYLDAGIRHRLMRYRHPL